MLDPGLTANENAQAYFERYRKAQSAEAQLPGLVEESRAEIAYLDQLALLIAQAPGYSELEALAATHDRFSYAITLSQPSEDWTGLRGRLGESVPPHLPTRGGKRYSRSTTADTVCRG